MRLSTAGEAMQAAYRELYGVESVILRHGFDKPALPPGMPRDPEGIIIGFVGNAYGRDAWEAFLGAVARLNDSGRLPRLRVRAFGSGVPYRHPGVEIEDRGWQPAEMMLQEIADTDFCYLPYWFEPHKRRHVELSFPGKFGTYLAAGRPVLFHGPEYADIAWTVRQYGVGVCVHSLLLKDITAAVERLILDAPFRESCIRAAQAAFQSEFNAGQMLENFARLIGVDPDNLATRASGPDFAHPGTQYG
jgi:glycosyltransferase involved in cell wall biosynthesis